MKVENIAVRHTKKKTLHGADQKLVYKYNKPIRHTIFNFNKLTSDLDIHANTPSS